MKKFVILAAVLVNFGYIKVDEAFCAKGEDLLAISSKENVTDDDIATVKKILKNPLTSKKNANAKDKNGNTPIVLAAQKGNIKILELLLKKSSKESQEEAVKYAANNNHWDCVELLISSSKKRNEIIDMKVNKYHTLLMEAVVALRPDVVQFLITKGADVNKETEEGDSALSIALDQASVESEVAQRAIYGNRWKDASKKESEKYEKNRQIADLLIKNGASMDKVTLWACKTEETSILRGIHQYYSEFLKEFWKNKGKEPLLKLLSNGEYSTIVFLTKELKINLDIVNRANQESKEEILHNVVIKRVYESVESLVNSLNGQLDGLKKYMGSTEFVVNGLLSGNKRLTEFLVHNLDEDSIKSMVEGAITNRDTKAIKALNESGIRIGFWGGLIRDIVRNKEINKLRLLNDAGVNLGKGLGYAISCHHWDVLKLLVEELKVDANEGFTDAIESGDLKLVKWFVDHGANINGVPGCKAGSRPISWAVSMGNGDIVDFLIKKGARLNFTDPNEDDLFAIAVASDDHETVELLFNTGEYDKKSVEKAMEKAKNGHMSKRVLSCYHRAETREGFRALNNPSSKVDNSREEATTILNNPKEELKAIKKRKQKKERKKLSDEMQRKVL